MFGLMWVLKEAPSLEGLAQDMLSGFLFSFPGLPLPGQSWRWNIKLSPFNWHLGARGLFSLSAQFPSSSEIMERAQIRLCCLCSLLGLKGDLPVLCC